MDVQTAFLYGKLNELCYMEQPPGFIEDDSLCCLLRKSIYGLKQAPRVWNQVINRFLVEIGFHQSLSDPALYFKGDEQQDENEMPMIVVIYVDDVVIIGPRMGPIQDVKSKLSERFEMTDLGEIKTLLGMEITRSQNGSVFIHQSRYISEILARFGMNDCSSVTTPIIPGITPSDESVDITQYQSHTGSVMWPSLASRPDICFSAGFLGRFNSNPTTSHMTAQKRVLRYLQGSENHGIFYDATSTESLIGYSDSDYGGDTVDRKSTSGMVFTLLGGAITWASSKQKTVSTSTVVAEYIALATSVKEAIWLKQLLSELGINTGPITIKVDSQGALDLATNARFSQKTKHIDIRHHFIRDHIEKGDIVLQYVPTDRMTADILTKPLARPIFDQLRHQLGMRSLNSLHDHQHHDSPRL